MSERHLVAYHTKKNKKHSIEIIVDRLIIRPDIQQRLTDSVETASNLSGGLVIINLPREERDLSFSQNTPARTAVSPLKN